LAVANIVQRSQRRCLQRIKASDHGLKMFIAPFVQILICSQRSCQQLYEVNKRPLKDLCALVAIWILIANSCKRWPGIFEGLLKDGGRAVFCYNLCASLFHKCISKEPNFGRIHLDRKYLYSPTLSFFKLFCL
jgi:hypothetical protein